MKVCASDFGGPHDPTSGTHGYHGDLLTGTMSYAELGLGTLLGSLPYKQRARITYNGKSVVAEKLDIGAGGAGCGGLPRGLDLWWETAQALGFSGLGVCDFELVDSSTPVSTGASNTNTAAIPNPLGGATSALSNTLALLKKLVDINFWKRVAVGVLGAVLIGGGIYFFMTKEPGSFKPTRVLENIT